MKPIKRQTGLIIAIGVMLCAMVSAACTQVPPPGSPAPSSMSALDQHLKSLEFERFEAADAFGTGTVPPDMASYRDDPTLALGAMFAKVIKSGAAAASCQSVDPTHFEMKRIVNVAPLAGCTPQTSRPEKFVEMIVQGGASANIGHLVGEAGFDSKFAYEFNITNPAAAVYPASQECVNVERAVTYHPPVNACDVYFVTGATVTQVTYRQYEEVEGNARYNAVINVEGKAYGSSLSMQSFRVLTVDLISLASFFAQNNAGFLVARTPAQAELVVEEVLNQPYAAFLEQAMLPSLDAEVVLPELSLENLDLNELSLATP